MTEMNGKLYAVNFHGPRQEYVLFQYDGGIWVEMSAFPVGGVDYSIANYKGQIYLGGSDPMFNGEGIVRWDSASNQWLSVGGGMGGGRGGIVHDLEIFQGELYAAGSFDSIGGISAKGLAKWNGTRWDSVGNQSQMTPNPFYQSVFLNSLQLMNNKLVVGGAFEVAGSQNIASWDGTAWTGSAANLDQHVQDMAIFNGDLIIYGPFIDSIGSTPFRQMARWDGTSWHSMGTVASDFVGLRDMLEYNGELYVVGSYSPINNPSIGGLTFDGIAKWDGTQWHIITSFKGAGYELREFNNRLYLNGQFTSSCNMPMDHVVKLCSHLECQPISGNIYQDDNNNCSSDVGEFPMNQQWINVQPGNYSIPTNASGDYSTMWSNKGADYTLTNGSVYDWLRIRKGSKK